MAEFHFQWARFETMSVRQLYECMNLRQKVFVVEQRAPYVDADGVDPACWHLMAWTQGAELVGYLRVVPPGVKFTECSIGRVVTSTEVRRRGLGHAMMRSAMEKISERFGDVGVRISAQAYLKKFYEAYGFRVTTGQTYLEDGIPHYEMLTIVTY